MSFLCQSLFIYISTLAINAEGVSITGHAKCCYCKCAYVDKEAEEGGLGWILVTGIVDIYFVVSSETVFSFLWKLRRSELLAIGSGMVKGSSFVLPLV